MGDSWVIPSVTSLTERSVVILKAYEGPTSMFRFITADVIRLLF